MATLAVRDCVSATDTSVNVYLVGDRYKRFSRGYRFKVDKSSRTELVLSVQKTQYPGQRINGMVSMNCAANGEYFFLRFLANHFAKKKILLPAMSMVPFDVDINNAIWVLQKVLEKAA